MNKWQTRSATTSSNAWRSWPSWRLAARRAASPSGERSPPLRRARRPGGARRPARPCPSASSGSTRSKTAASRTKRAVDSAMSTSPGAAPCSRRAATFTVSPVMSACRVEASPATTSPVLTPMRHSRVAPWSRSSSLLSIRSPSRMSSAARTARSRVVLMRRGDAEHRHHRVADELLHRAAVPLDRLRHGVEVAHHDAPERLGVQALAERRGARHVAEDDGDGLAYLGGRRGLSEPFPTRVAEAGPLGVLDAARRAGKPWPDECSATGGRDGVDSRPNRRGSAGRSLASRPASRAAAHSIPARAPPRRASTRCDHLARSSGTPSDTARPIDWPARTRR